MKLIKKSFTLICNVMNENQIYLQGHNHFTIMVWNIQNLFSFLFFFSYRDSRWATTTTLTQSGYGSCDLWGG